jgi:CTP:molybdopterin cytidylyltransferase MocA
MAEFEPPQPHPEPRVAVVLSAGASERFHGEPKALLPVGPERAIVRVVRISFEAGCDRVVVVAGPHIRQVSTALAGWGAEVVENPEWALGRTGSVQRGLRAATPASSVLLWPVDHPFVAPGTVARLYEAARQDLLALWLIPSYRGRGGHPVLLRADALRRVAELAPGAPLRGPLGSLGPQVRRVAVPDPGVLDNVDTPDRYREALDAWAWRGDEG